MFCMWFWLCNICCKLYDRQYNCISYRLVHHAVVIINGNHLNWLPCKNGSYCQRAGGPSVINYSLITARLKCNRPILHRSHIPLIFFTPSTRKVYQQSLTSYSAFFWKILNLRRFILIVLSTVCILSAFLPCDAMLARVLATSLCLSVCHKSEFCWKGWTNWAGFWHGSFLRPIINCVIRKFAYLQKSRVLPFGTLLQTLDLENFAMAYRLSKCVIDLAREVDAPTSMINWTVVGQLDWQYLRAPTLDCASLSQWLSSSVYSMILLHGSISDRWYLWYCVE